MPPPGGIAVSVGSVTATSPPGRSHRVAVVQQPPVLLDREESLARALASLEEAANNGAELVTFPEAYLPGYPEYIWGLRPGDDYHLSRELHGRLLANAVDLNSDDLQPLQKAAQHHEAMVMIGVHERATRSIPGRPSTTRW